MFVPIVTIKILKIDMKLKLLTFVILGLMGLGLASCNKTEQVVESADEVSQEVLAQIARLGFSTEEVQKEGDHYIVEGDIILHEEDLYATPTSPTLRIAEVEQYRTNNLVEVVNAPRAITIRIVTSGAGKLPTSYIPAVDEAIDRFNAQNLTLTFSRVTSGGDIVIKKPKGNPKNFPQVASAGFPSGGNPYGEVLVNPNFFGSDPDLAFLASVLAHEIGHCIGFRHTDYMDRSFSCNGANVNEGEGSIGAVHIPGTPTAPDEGSWMLSCIGVNENRPFNNNDIIALDYLY